MFEEKCLKEEKIFSGDFLTLKKDTVELIDGQTATREIIVNDDAAAVVALDEENNIVLVKQYRYALKREVLEIPAGKVEKGEDFLNAAKRELVEETGYESNNWQSLDYFFSALFSTQKTHLFLALNCKKTKELNLDEGEFLTVIKKPFKFALDEVLNGKIKDSKTIVAIFKANTLIN